jgi:hypothetical protein
MFQEERNNYFIRQGEASWGAHRNEIGAALLLIHSSGVKKD